MTLAAHTHRQVSHYQVEELLASGGMGDVYRATDLRLGRRVALKFLRALDDAAMRHRLLREAQAASQLDHPNICTIFEVDETAAGEIFIAMAYYDGETLDRVLQRGALPLARALSIAVQAGRGLAAAHDELLVHRDIKPGNLMIARGDTVKILDFGIATLLGEAHATEHGTVVGTPAYMSPERLRGEPIDQRADIWSLGAVLYEVVTGVPPFRGSTLTDVATAILDTDPQPPTRLDPALPPRLDQLIAAALAKDPSARYERVEAFVHDLVALQGALDLETVTHEFPALRARTSIAVLPFEDMTPAKDQAYLCDGIAEEVLRALSRVPDLHVASRTSAFQFKHRVADVREIGARLGVEAILEGSVRRVGDRVRISAQLVSVRNGYRLWYGRYDRDLQDIFAVEDEIAEEIARALDLTLNTRRAAPPRAQEGDGEAYEQYLQGRQFIHQHRRKAFEVALQIFSRVIEHHPAFARAYAGIADCHSFLRLYFGGGEDAVRAADEASARALALDPDLPDAQSARGMALMLRRDFEQAEIHLRRAIELDRSLYDAEYIYGRLCFSAGRIPEAVEHFRQACAIVPEAYDSWYLLGMCYRRLGEPDKARTTSFECIEAVKRVVRSHPDDTRAWTMGAAVLAEMGEPERAATWVARALAIDADEPIIRYNAACVYVSLGRHDEAFACLAAALSQGGIFRDWAENDPDLDALRTDPRFAEVMSGARR